MKKEEGRRGRRGEKEENKSIVFLNFHHIIMDGLSMNIFWREFTRLYNGEKPTLSDIQFKDYAAWIRKEEFIQEDLYWRDRLSTEVEPFNLPVDYQRPALQSFEGRSISEYLSNDNVDNIHKLAKKTGCTDFMIYMSALMLLLSKYSGQEDILLGSVVSGRTHKDLESIMGMFVNTIALRAKPEKEKRFLDYLKDLKETVLAANENQEYPFEELVEELNLQRDISRNPLFDVMFVYQNNEELKEKLIIHTMKMFQRLKEGYFETNSILKDILANYEREVNMADEINTLLQERYGLTVNIHEICYIAVYLRAYSCRKLTAIILCDIGESIADNMERQIKDYCGEKIHIIKRMSLSEYRMNPISVDLLITGSRVYNVMLPEKTKVIYVDYLLKEEDLKKIQDYLLENSNMVK